MRTVADEDCVRLYHLDGDTGVATTLFYGPLADALRRAATEPEEQHDELWIQTANDVIEFRSLAQP